MKKHITLHVEEGAYLLSVLAKYWHDPEVRRAMRLLSSKTKLGKEERRSTHTETSSF